ncbi:MAG: hypothetical protein FWH27_09645, partial [Planctomycetaceae bacterium]|nr:hypothetical protein [Planctomycetaceae bacterium]
MTQKIMNKSRMIFVAVCTIATLTVYSLYAYVLVPVVLPMKERVKPPSIKIGEEFQDREFLKILFDDEGSWVFEKTQMVTFSDGAGSILFKEEDWNQSETSGGTQLRVSP